MSSSTLIYNARLLDEKSDTPGAVLISDGKIRSVFHGYFTSAATVESFAKATLKEDGHSENEKISLYDAHGLTLTPAFIDMHVHLRYPGQTQKEDLNSGLHAAAAGGFGTIVAMPNTSPVVSSVETAMKIEREAAAIGLTHLFQTVSITKDFDGKDTSHLDNIEKKYIPVISEDGRDVIDSAVMLEGMSKAGMKGIVVSCHSEDLLLSEDSKPLRKEALEIMKEVGLSAWGTDNNGTDSSEEPVNTDSEILESAISKIDSKLSQANKILAMSEDIATERNITLAEQARCHVHIAHVSTKKSLESVRRGKELAKKTGTFEVTCEVTPHHLALCGTKEPYIRALVNPPLRSEEDRLALIQGLFDGTADVISTDHAPHTLEDKANGAPGFTGEETAFAVANTVLVKDFGMNPCLLSKLMSANPARILGLNKGLLQTGYDADLTLIDPDEQWTVNSELFYSKGKATPFEGKTLTGCVKGLFIDGRLVLER